MLLAGQCHPTVAQNSRGVRVRTHQLATTAAADAAGDVTDDLPQDVLEDLLCEEEANAPILIGDEAIDQDIRNVILHGSLYNIYLRPQGALPRPHLPEIARGNGYCPSPRSEQPHLRWSTKEETSLHANCYS